MPQEILLYGQVYAQSSIDFINGISAVSEDDDLVVRINTNGGDVLFGWGMVAKFNEFKGVKKIKVDGSAYSMGAYFLAYADAENIEALDVSDFLIHRAGYPDWYEDYMPESEKEHLKVINSSLFDALKNRIDVNKFKEISGKTLKEVFSMDGRIDVFLTAQQAKQIGLIGKITKITPTKKAEISAINQRIAANYTGGKNQNTNNFNPSKMTKEDFKREHPEAYAAIVNEGVTAERDRCGAYLAYITADKDAVIAGIKSGEQMSATTQAELNIKIVQAMNSTATPKLDADGKPIVEAVIPPVETPETPPTPTAKTQLDKVRELLAPKKSA